MSTLPAKRVPYFRSSQIPTPQSKVIDVPAADRTSTPEHRKVTKSIHGFSEPRVLSADEFKSVLILALQARAPHRREMKSPPASRRSSHASKKFRNDSSAYRRAGRHLHRLGKRALNDLHRHGFPVPDVDTIAAGFELYAEERLGHLLRHGASGGDGEQAAFEKWAYLSPGQAQRVARGAALILVRYWDPNWIETRVEQGSKGGTASRRTSTWGWQEVEYVTSLLRHDARPVDIVDVLSDRWSPRTIETIIKRTRSLLPMVENAYMEDFNRWR